MTRTYFKTGKAFSLIELMIAIVILGLGMVMVATVFPIAVGRARSLTEATRGVSIATVADTTIDMIAGVNGRTNSGSGFVGDMLVAYLPSSNQHQFIAFSDTRVHALAMENIEVAPRKIVPGRNEPWLDEVAMWHADAPDFHSDLLTIPVDYQAQGELFCDGFGMCAQSFLGARVRMEDRVYPPIRARENIPVSGVFDEGADPDEWDIEWDSIFNTRKYVWGILHRLIENVGPARDDYLGASSDTFINEAVEASERPRRMDLYFVMLRRPSATQRFARQDPTTAPNIFHSEYDGQQRNYKMTATPEKLPKALPAERDVLLPEPWRIQIQLPEIITTRENATGIPTEIEVPPASVVDDLGASVDAVTMLGEMFQRGARFVDELNGQVYRVNRRRLKSISDQGHFNYVLTLDREILLDDIEVIQQDPILPCPGCQNDLLDAEERLRTVWVYPPPVLKERAAQGIVIFEGPQPVIDIQTRAKSFVP